MNAIAWLAGNVSYTPSTNFQQSTGSWNVLAEALTVVVVPQVQAVP